MTSVQPRARAVEVAFWCWLAAAIVLVFLGIWLTASAAPVFLRGAGVIAAVAGLAVGYLAGATRSGRKRFRRAAVALSLTLAVLLIVFAMLTLGGLWLVPMMLLWAGAFAVTRPAANDWFDTVDFGRNGG